MAYSIFYSWQSDAPNECNRAFIRQCINAAAGALAADIAVEDSPRVESGMEGISGTPEVATVMFTRIKRSAVFIGDMTLVGSIPNGGGNAPKRVPNPNVSLEMGYAAGTIGWGRVICVMNEHFGVKAQLPFDIRNRRFPIDYSLAPGQNPLAGNVRTDLTRWIKIAIETVVKSELEAVNDAISALDINCLNLMRAGGQNDFFAAPNPNATTIGGPLDTAKFSAAVTRLLDLRILKADIDPTQGAYAYHWTYLGKQALIKLAIRQQDRP